MTTILASSSPRKRDPQPCLLTDRFGRRLDYLRLAVTARCNLNCRYCRPKRGDWIVAPDALQDEDIVRLARILRQLGVRKVRITGGEPLVRPGIGQLLLSLRTASGIRELYLTTNGIRLSQHLPELQAAAVDGVNVSLDTLRPDRYEWITGFAGLGRVWEGIEHAVEAGLRVKLNVVVQGGVNDDEIADFCRLTRAWPFCVRFIELMPMGPAWRANTAPVSAAEILSRIEGEFGPLSALPNEEGSTARTYRISGHVGTIGVIAAHSRTFCSQCNRLRITPDGQLRLCLYQPGGLDLRSFLRRGLDDEAIAREIQLAVRNKPRDGHAAEKQSRQASQEPMILVGG